MNKRDFDVVGNEGTDNQELAKGIAFEEFLKVYLEKIGLDEVVVTQRSSDGGIDLEAVRYGVGGFAGADAVDYFVQAKRNKPGTTIPIEKVRAPHTPQ